MNPLYEVEAEESEMRMYRGPKNNRVDRIPSVSNSFRVQGVPDHIQKTNVFVQERVRLERTRVADVLNTDGINPESMEELTNRFTYKYPSYPSDLPTIPVSGDRCTDPWLLNA